MQPTPIESWAKAHLISEVPRELPVWHWTQSTASACQIRDILRAEGELSGWTEGAVGRGLYVSLSAIDTMDKGREVVHARLRAGTRVLMVDAELFNFGVPEMMEILLDRMGWDWQPTPWRGKLDPDAAQPAKVVIPQLLDRLDLPACAYVFGFHMAFMVRNARCLIDVTSPDPAESVAEYVRSHPKERPTLVPGAVVQQWLASRGKA